MNATNERLDRVEADLERTLGGEPQPAVRELMDARVEAAIALRAARPAPRGISRLALGWRRSPRRLSIAAGLAGAVLIAGTSVAAGLGLLFQQAAGPIGGLHDAWEQGTPIGTETSAGGYTIRLDRAYVDAGEVVAAVEARGPSAQGSTRPPQVGGAELVDATGRSLQPLYGGVAFVPGVSANMLAFTVPPNVRVEGPFTLHVRSLMLPPDGPEATPSGQAGGAGATPADATAEAQAVGDAVVPNDGRGSRFLPIVNGDWALRFDVPSHGGVQAVGDAPATKDGITARVAGLTIAPTMLSALVSIEGLPTDREWSAALHVEHDGRRIDPGTGGVPGAGRIEVMAFDPAAPGDPSGQWKIVVDQVMSVREPAAGGSDVRIDGPWVVTVTIP